MTHHFRSILSQLPELLKFHPDGEPFPVQFNLVDASFGTLQAPFIHAQNYRGYCLGMIQLRPPYEDGMCPFSNLWVAPHARRKGIATRLIFCAEQWCLLHGANTIAGKIDEENLDVISFYEHIGFVAIDAQEGGKLVARPTRFFPATTRDPFRICAKCGKAPSGMHQVWCRPCKAKYPAEHEQLIEEIRHAATPPSPQLI